MGGRSGKSHVFPARAAILLAAVALLTVVLSPTAKAAEGLLDPTFGSGGFTIFNEPESPQEGLADVVVLPDGKILAGGMRGSSEGFLLARYNADGTPDLELRAQTGSGSFPTPAPPGPHAGSTTSRCWEMAGSSPPGSGAAPSRNCSTPSRSAAICRAA